jgi:pimeloyl-ACP methyl ester carboxylesterase
MSPAGVNSAAGTDIRCHYVRVQERLVHYRRAGHGPAVILMHQTPQSSKTMEPLMRRLAPNFTAIALDSPGFGLSERLPGEVWTIDQLCDWLAATLDALGIRRAAFCSQHTGATISTEFARHHPNRAACIALDGYTAFTREECDSILPHQLYRFTPSWDGSHLVWAWSRFRDGWMFFPWSNRSLATRRDMDMPDAARIQSWQIMELLRSRENHLAIYPPVFRWDGHAAAHALRVPALLASTRDDQLFPHLDRLGEVPPNVTLLRLPIGARDDLEAAQIRFIRDHVDAAVTIPPEAPASVADASGALRTYAAGLAVQKIHASTSGDILLALHGAGECSAQALHSLQSRHAGPIIAIDLPGHGESAGEVGDPAQAAQAVAAALSELGVERYRVWGRGLGAAVAVELAHQRPENISGVTLEELRLLDDAEKSEYLSRYATPIVPAWDGTHLITLWNEIRDREFFVPWYRRTHDAIRRVEPDVDAERLTQKLFAALLCKDWPAAHRAWLDWPLSRLDGLRCPVTFAATTGDGWARDIDALKKLAAS